MEQRSSAPPGLRSGHSAIGSVSYSSSAWATEPSTSAWPVQLNAVRQLNPPVRRPPSTNQGDEAPARSRLRRAVESHDKQLAGLRQELGALRECLEDAGYLNSERFLSRVHIRAFRTVIRAHPCKWDASLVDVLQAQGIIETIAAGCGLPATRALRTASPAVCQAAASVAADLGAPAYGASCAVCVLGGFNGENCLSFAELFDPDAGTWQALRPMAERRAGAAAAVLGGMAYICGGSNDSQCLSSVERLDIASGTWETMPQMSDRRDGAVSVSVDNQIYIFGGYNGLRFLSSAERFDPTVRIWETLPQMAERRYRGAAGVLGGLIYVLGGSDDLRCLSSAQRFDSNVGLWEMLPAMEVRRDGPAVVSFGGCLYVHGGNDGMHYLNSVEMFDPRSFLWASIRPMLERRYRAAAAVLRGEVYVFGGYDGLSYLSSAERFDNSLAEWEITPPMRYPRAWIASVAVHRWGMSGQPAARWGRLGLSNFSGMSELAFQCHHEYLPTTPTRQQPQAWS